jgi:hypothetical protein
VTISVRLLLEAPTATSTLDDGHITGGVKHTVGVAMPVAFELGKICPLVLLKCSRTISVVDNGRTNKAIRAGLFVLSDEFAQRSRLKASFEDVATC